MLTPITRAALDQLEKRDLITASSHKADLYIIEVEGKSVVVKDFSTKPLLTRLIGRIQIRHECRAYLQVGRTPGVPKFFGRIDRYALAIEFIDGEELIASDRLFSNRRQNISGLRKTFDEFLAKGFLHLDARGRHNILIRENGEIVVVDLAGSTWIDPQGFMYRMLRPCILRFYAGVLLKWRKLVTESRFHLDERTTLSRIFGFIRQPHHWLRRED